jgi:uncharacterized protein involved in outer membrane biogenesis
MKKLGYGAIGLVVLAIAAVLVVPSLVDWNDFKPEIAAEVKKATGRDIALEGDLSFAVLPYPHLSVEGVRLSNISGAAARDMVSLRELKASVKLAPLVKGAIEVASVELIGPVIELERLADGRVNWAFAPPAATAAPAGATGTAAPQPGPAKADSPGDSNGNGSSFSLDSFRVVDGKLIYRDAKAGTVERIDGIALDGSAGSESGPFAIDGKLVAGGIPLRVDLSTGKFAKSGTVPVNVRIRPGNAEATLSAKGTVTDIETEPKISLALSAEGGSLAGLIAALSGGAGAGPASAFTLAAGIEATQSDISVNGLKLTVGGMAAGGTARVRLGDKTRIDVALKAPLVDLNSLLATAVPATGSAAATPAAGGESGGAPGGSARTQQSAAGSPAAGFALPKDIEANVNISAEEVAWKTGRARQVSLIAALRDGVLTLDTLSARLPGAASVSASGRAGGGAKFAYSGRVDLAATNLRATLAWLEAELPDIPADRLRTLTVAGEFSGDTDQLRVTRLNAQVDATRIAAAATVALRAQPAFGASVSVDNINLDSYLPVAVSEPAKAVPGGPSGGNAPSSGASAKKAAAGGKSGSALDTLNANLVLRVGRLVYKKSGIEDIAFDGTVQNGTVNIRNASVRNFAGTSAQVAGTLRDLAAVPTFAGTVAAASNDLTGLFRVAGIEPPVPPKSLGAMRLSATTGFEGDRLNVDGQLQLGDLRTALKGGVSGLAGATEIDAALSLQHGSFIRFVRLFDPAFSPRNSRLGEFRLSTRLKGGMTKLVLSDIAGNVGEIALSGKGAVDMAGVRPAFDLTLNSGVIPVTDFLAAPQRADAGDAVRADGTPRLIRVAATPAAASSKWSSKPLDTALLALADATIDLSAKALLYDNLRVDTPKVVAVLKDRVLDISRVSGTMFEGSFEMTGRLDARQTPTATTQVRIAKANVRKLLFEAAAFDIANGILDFKMDLAAAGASQLDMIRALNGNGRIDVADGSVRGFDLKSVSDSLKNAGRIEGLLGILGSAMGGGTTKFSKLFGTFKIEKGIMRTDDLALAADAGQGNAAGFVDLPAWHMDMNTVFRLTEHPKAPPFRARAVGPPDEPRRIFDFADLQAWVLQRGVGSLIRKLIPGAKSSGGSTADPAQQNPSGQQQQQAPNPADLLKGLLKGLGR